MADTKTNITVQLTGTDGNIFAIIAKVREALRRNGRSDLVKEFTDYITSSSSYEEARIAWRAATHPLADREKSAVFL